MKSLKESLLDSSFDAEDLGIEYPEITNKILQEALMKEFNYSPQMQEFVEYVTKVRAQFEGTIRSTKHPSIKDMSEVLINCIDKEIKSYYSFPDEKNLKRIREAKRMFEELDDIMNKMSKEIATSTDPKMCLSFLTGNGRCMVYFTFNTKDKDAAERLAKAFSKASFVQDTDVRENMGVVYSVADLKPKYVKIFH